jgi:hypothetical protein
MIQNEGTYTIAMECGSTIEPGDGSTTHPPFGSIWMDFEENKFGQHNQLEM